MILKKLSLFTREQLSHILLSKKGWTHDGKKILKAMLILGMIWFTYQCLGFMMNAKKEIRFEQPVNIVTLEEYTNDEQGFSFLFPSRFIADQDSEHRYGPAYLGGFRLENNRQIGCDMRQTDTGLNFEKSDTEISAALEKELASTAKDFQKERSNRYRLGGNPAFLFGFSFTDPLGNRVRLDQTMTSRGGSHYLILCGSGAETYTYFEKDFESFLRSFRFDQ